MKFSKTIAALLLGASSIAALASSAYAADAVATEAPAAGFDWSGVYVGFGGGVGAALHEFNLGGLFDLNALGSDGVFGEVSVGYDHMVTERLLVGALASARYGNLGSVPFLFSPDAKLDTKYGFDAGLRAGYLVTPEMLGYVIGGYSWQKFKLSDAVFATDWSSDGYFAGVGLETVLSGNWTVKTEYRYSNYGSADPFDSGGLFKLAASTHRFTLGANYRFGGQNSGQSSFEMPAYNWTGFYVGGAIGAGAMINDQTTVGIPVVFSGDGILGEASIGYDHEIGDNWVLGALIDGRLAGVSSQTKDPGGNSVEIKANYGFDILARGGVKLSAATLAYALAGYSWQHFEVSTSGVGAPGKLTDSASGFVAGAGVETALTDKTTINLEYRYNKFGNVDFGFGGNIGFEPAFHTVRVGAKYKFN